MLLAPGAGSAPQAAPPQLTFVVAATTGVRLVDMVWTGRRFLYVENTTNRVVAATGRSHQSGGSVFGDKAGRLVAVSAQGTVTTIARFPDGLNPIAVVPPRLRTTGTPAAGLYLTDTFPGTVLRAAAGQFQGHAGAVIVGSEVRGLIWLVAPSGQGFRTTLLPTSLTATGYNLEGATFVP